MRLGFERTHEFFQAFLYPVGGAAVVEADALGGAEEGAVGEVEFFFFFGNLGGVGVGESLAIDPGEVGGFDFGDNHLGELVGEVGGEVVAVLSQGGNQFLSPGFTVLIGGFGSVVSEAVNFGEGVAFGGLKTTADGVVGNDGVGVTESSDVVGLGGRKKGDGVLAKFLGKVEGGEVGGLFFVENEVAVNFVGDEEDVEFLAEGGELDHFALGENAAERILGVRKNEDAGVRADRSDHFFPVKSPDALDLDVFDLDEVGFAIVVNAEERWVDGGAGHERFTGLGEGAAGHREGGNEAAKVNDFLFLGGVSDAIGEILL